MNLKEAIQALGDTPEQICILLRKNDITGFQDNSCQCPISKYLLSCGFKTVRVESPFPRSANGNMIAKVKISSLLWNTEDFGPVVSQWIRDFDEGHYPEFISV